MLQNSTLKLLRFPFSIFLMPVFWFALSIQQDININKSLLIFVILHLLVYPSSNGYNSYMDRDTGSIGGIEHPPEPLRELFVVSVMMDILAILLSLFISPLTVILIIVYIFFSRMYSYRKVRLKQYPIIGYLTVVLNQGSLVFVMIYLGIGNSTSVLPFYPIIAAALLIGGFYPITQIYQHDADKADGVRSISLILGKRGTFLFCAFIYLLAFCFLIAYFHQLDKLYFFYILQIFFTPVVIYFLIWANKVWKDETKADFKHTMRMNWIASICSNAGFITLLILQHRG